MAINSKSTKAEILAAYKEAEKQRKNLETELKNKPKSTPSANKPNPSVAIRKVATTANKNNHQDISKTIQSLAEIQGGFGSAVTSGAGGVGSSLSTSSDCACACCTNRLTASAASA